MNNKIAYFIIGGFIIGALIFREQPPPIKTVLYNDYIISLLSDGNVEAIRTSNWKKDKRFSKALQQYNPKFLSSDSKTLAMITKEKAFVWSDEKSGWTEIGRLPRTEEVILYSLILRNRFFVIYPTRIVELPSNRVFEIPDSFKLSQLLKDSLMAVHAAKDKLWFGTLRGKMGGELLGLDIESGEWNQIQHIDRYINSFTEDDRGTMWVVWVRSNLSDGNLDADTVLSNLSSDGIPRGYNGFLQNHFIQAIAYNKYDGNLYGINRNRIIRLGSDSVETIADMGNLHYFKDVYEKAGVFSAINELLIVDKDIFVIPHRIDGLFLCEKGNIRKIEESKSIAYGFKTRWANLNRLYWKLEEGLGLQRRGS